MMITVAGIPVLLSGLGNLGVIGLEELLQVSSSLGEDLLVLSLRISSLPGNGLLGSNTPFAANVPGSSRMRR